MEIYGVIMAGGGGTRFWPLSKSDSPKQLLNLSGKDVMVNETADRLCKVLKRENLYVITAESQAEKIREVSFGKIKGENIISEPCAKNTAAAIGYSAVKILKERGDGVIIVSPADAYIRDCEEYARVLKTAAAAAEKGGIITIGIKPTFPATGYGYIKARDAEKEVKPVEKFVEKPDAFTAKRYIESGEYFWNSGVFVFKASEILKEFQKSLPDIFESLKEIEKTVGTEGEKSAVSRIYPQMRSISVDYGIMEKSSDISVAIGDFGWSDVGSWDMLGTVKAPDKNGNVLFGKTLNIDTENSVIYSSGRLIATIGLNDAVVVETDGAVLVCAKDRAQDVKKIVDELKEKGYKDLI